MTNNWDLEFTAETEQNFWLHSTKKRPAHVQAKEDKIWAAIRENNSQYDEIGYLFH